MARRGRITIVALGFAIGAAVGLWRLDRERSAPASPAGVTPPGAATPLAEAPPEVLRDPPVTRERFERLLAGEPAGASAPGSDGNRLPPPVRLEGLVEPPASRPELVGPLRVEYTLHPELTSRVFEILSRAKVALGHVLVLDPATGRLLVYASTNDARFPGTRTYPAASLIKIVTAAAALHYARDLALRPCRYRGSPHRLTRSRIDPPRRGKEMSLRKALATSNNQCFAQLAVHGIGAATLLDTIERFGLLLPPAPGHAAGSAEAGRDRWDLARLGCGLTGCWITPLHAAQLVATLDEGLVVPPRWIERVRDGAGRELALPARRPPSRVMTPELAAELRDMLVDTTRAGTARRAFQTRRRRPMLGSVRVAGKTGSLSGSDPNGRYEWFAGVAPAEDPRLAVAVVLVQSPVWRRSASQIAAEVLRTAFCPDGACSASAAEHWLGASGPRAR